MLKKVLQHEPKTRKGKSEKGSKRLQLRLKPAKAMMKRIRAGY